MLVEVAEEEEEEEGRGFTLRVIQVRWKSTQWMVFKVEKNKSSSFPACALDLYVVMWALVS